MELVPKEGPIDWGHVMSGDVCTQTLQLHNPSQLTVNYKLMLESLEYNSEFKSESVYKRIIIIMIIIINYISCRCLQS